MRRKLNARKTLAAFLIAAMAGTLCSNVSFAQGENVETMVYSDGTSQTVTTQTTVWQSEEAIDIELSDEVILVDGEQITSNEDSAVALSSNIVYYEDKDTYDSGNAYGEGSSTDKHTAEEAAENQAVVIREAGTYRLTGKLSAGQIQVDLGEDAAEDETAVVTLILDNVDITCDIAPAIIFYNVYECDNNWSTETASSEVNTENAGANLVIADGSINNITGSHVAKIYKDNGNKKKLWKQDGAVYSYMSMNVYGEEEETGVLNITADNEGLDSELHLTIYSGNINIFADNDGINTNEDGVSVTTINGGNLHIAAGLGAEGDGVDSNGWLVINGGTVVATANPGADSGLDSDMGSYINGGTVIALGSTMDWAESDSEQVTMNLQFASQRNQEESIVITDVEGNVVFAYAPTEDEVIGNNIRTYQGAVISCPNLEMESTYFVYLGATVQGEEAQGVYDAATVTGFTDGVQQMYTGTDVGHIFGQGGQQPGGEQPGVQPGGVQPGGVQPGGEQPGGQKPGGVQPGGEQPSMPSDDNTESGSIYFYMADKVNSFSGVQNNSVQNGEELRGDVNGDGEVKADDALIVLKYVANIETEINLKAADCDGEKGVTASDALAILKDVAQIEKLN